MTRRAKPIRASPLERRARRVQQRVPTAAARPDHKQQHSGVSYQRAKHGVTAAKANAGVPPMFTTRLEIADIRRRRHHALVGERHRHGGAGAWRQRLDAAVAAAFVLQVAEPHLERTGR